MFTTRPFFVAASLAMLLCLSPVTMSYAELVAYWPLDGIENDTVAEVVNGFDMDAVNLDPGFDVVEGKIDNAIAFSNEFATLLTRIHDPDEPLPINKHPEFTITMWANVEGTGQNDLRLLSEGSTADNNPLFNIGTANNGDNGTLDIYLRNSQASTPTVNHPRTNAEPFNGEWNHIGWTFSEGIHDIYINGVYDSSYDFQSFGEIDPFQLDNTSIGGIQRANPSHWVTGLIDDVAMWDEVLPPISLSLLAAEAVTPESALDILFGDFNFDGEINTADYNILVGNFRDDGDYQDGDMNGDGTIDLFDFGDFIAASEAAGAAVPQSVPEPMGLSLLGIGALFFGLFRNRGSKRG